MATINVRQLDASVVHRLRRKTRLGEIERGEVVAMLALVSGMPV